MSPNLQDCIRHANPSETNTSRSCADVIAEHASGDLSRYTCRDTFDVKRPGISNMTKSMSIHF